MVPVSSVIPRRSVLPWIKLRLKQHLEVRSTGLQKMLSCDLSGHFDFSEIAGRSHRLLVGWGGFPLQMQPASYTFCWEGSWTCCCVYNQRKELASRLFLLLKYWSSTFFVVAPHVLPRKSISPKDHPENFCQDALFIAKYQQPGWTSNVCLCFCFPSFCLLVSMPWKHPNIFFFFWKPSVNLLGAPADKHQVEKHYEKM